MLDIGWSELILIGVVALIVVGPRDLPEMFRTLGRFTAKARAMARDFSRVMEDAARETGVSDIAKDLRETTSAKSLGLDAVKSAATKFEQWDPLKAAKAATAPVPAAPAPVAAKPATEAAAVAEMTPLAAAKPALGPATQAQADAVAEKAAIARDAAQRMKAASSAGGVKPAAKPRAAKQASSEPASAKPTAVKPAAKAPRKTRSPALAAAPAEQTEAAPRPRGRVRKKPETEA